MIYGCIAVSGIAEHNTELSLAFQHKQQLPSLYWAHPLIHLRKAKLVAFLHQHNYTWREDATNQSPKYLRSHVRNELLPLLHDIMGSNDNDNSNRSLHRRLDSIQAQSLEIWTDLEERARAYLQKADGDQQRQLGFLLPTTTATMLGVVHKHALYLWIMNQTTVRQHNSSMFSYKMMQRICAQLDNPTIDNGDSTWAVGGIFSVRARDCLCVLEMRILCLLMKTAQCSYWSTLSWPMTCCLMTY